MTDILQIFQIEYPLPKADLLAVHEFVSLQHSPSLGLTLPVSNTDWLLANHMSTTLYLLASCKC